MTNLVQEDASAHVGEGDEGHDDKRADQVALGPCLKDQLIRIRGLWHDLVLLPVHVGNGAHGESRDFSMLAAEAEAARRRAVGVMSPGGRAAQKGWTRLPWLERGIEGSRDGGGGRRGF